MSKAGAGEGKIENTSMARSGRSVMMTSVSIDVAVVLSLSQDSIVRDELQIVASTTRAIDIGKR